MNNWNFMIVLGLSFALDFVFGDPPNRYHPVAWMGNAIATARRWSPKHGNIHQFLFGGMFLVLGVTLVGMIGWGIDRSCNEVPLTIAVVIQAVVLKATFSARSLARAAWSVATPLQNNDLSAARYQVAYHLVSRDVSALDATDLSAATIESIAENTSDSVAPLFFFAIAGLPGALVYRFVNTCDAMLGYHTPQLEWLGKASARLDDVLNLVPARITAISMLVVGGLWGKQRFVDSIRIWYRDRLLTASPNAGHPMSAAAGVLGVVLEKKGHYLLGEGMRAPNVLDIHHAVRLLWATAIMSTAFVCSVIVFVLHWAGGGL